MAGSYRVPAVQAAAAVLRALLSERDGRGASQADLVRATGVSKSSMHNLLATLVEERLVSHEQRTREYRLGPALIALGAIATRHTRILAAAMDATEPLAAEHGLSFAVAQPIAGNRVQVIDRFYPPQALHVGVTIGSDFGPFDGALGKCILADMPKQEAEAIVRSQQLPAHTARTITQADALLADVEQARLSGWAASRQELNANVAVSAPVLGPGGRAEAFLFALAFANQVTEEGIRTIGSRLQEIAAAISAEAGVTQIRSDTQVTATSAAGIAARKEEQ